MNFNCDSSSCKANVVIQKHRCNCSIGQKNCSVNVMETLNKIGKNVITESDTDGNTQISTVEVISDSDYISSTTVSEANADARYSASVVVVLGALVGLLVILVVVTATGWAWTCLVLRNRGRMNISSMSVR